MFVTPCIDRRRAKAQRLHDFKSSFDSSHHIQVGSGVLPTLNHGCVQLNDLHITHLENSLAGFLAKDHLLLRQIFANTHFIWTNFDSFSGLCIRICEFFFLSFCRWDEYPHSFEKWIAAGFLVLGPLLRRVPSRLALLQVSRYLVRVCVCQMGYCGWLLLALPIPLQRDLGCGAWCRKPFEKCSISVLSSHTVNEVSWCCDVGHDCKWFRLPEFQSLILRFFQSYPIHSILVCRKTAWRALSSPKSRAPFYASTFINTGLIESQCLEPSGCRSSWSKCRRFVVTILENDTAKSPPYREWAWIIVHFFSIVGMLLFVNRDALGVRMTRHARVSIVLGAAQVSLWLLVTFLSSFFLTHEGLRAIHCWTWALVCGHEVHSPNALVLWI